MKRIQVNNNRKVNMELISNGLKVENFGNTDFTIPDHEIIMLLNYYRNCKSGIEKSEYIKQED